LENKFNANSNKKFYQINFGQGEKQTRPAVNAFPSCTGLSKKMDGI